MTRPNLTREQQPRDIQPQQQQTTKHEPINTQKILTINFVTTVVICLIVFMANSITTNKLANKIDGIVTSNEQTEEITGEAERGIIADMGEFTLNLADKNARRYLKVSVALELSKTAEEINSTKGDMIINREFEIELNQYKPAIKDAIISILSSKTSDELATIPGKETAKEQIAEAVEAVYNGEREVIRVSFGQFIMQ